MEKLQIDIIEEKFVDWKPATRKEYVDAFMKWASELLGKEIEFVRDEKEIIERKDDIKKYNEDKWVYLKIFLANSKRDISGLRRDEVCKIALETWELFQNYIVFNSITEPESEETDEE